MTYTQKAVEAAARAAALADLDEETREIIDLDKHMLRVCAHYEEIAVAALTAALAVDGLCLVPKEPSVAMLAAGEMAWINDPLKRSSTLYRAMIAAASDGEERK